MQGREFGEVSSDPIKRDTDRDEIARTSSWAHPTVEVGGCTQRPNVPPSATSSTLVSTAGPTPPSNAESCVHGAILSVLFALPDLPVDVQTHTVTVDA